MSLTNVWRSTDSSSGWRPSVSNALGGRWSSIKTLKEAQDAALALRHDVRREERERQPERRRDEYRPRPASAAQGQQRGHPQGQDRRRDEEYDRRHNEGHKDKKHAEKVQLSASEKKNCVDNRLCFNCKEPGHAARDCPKSTKTDVSTESRRVNCDTREVRESVQKAQSGKRALTADESRDGEVGKAALQLPTLQQAVVNTHQAPTVRAEVETNTAERDGDAPGLFTPEAEQRHIEEEDDVVVLSEALLKTDANILFGSGKTPLLTLVDCGSSTNLISRGQAIALGLRVLSDGSTVCVQFGDNVPSFEPLIKAEVPVTLRAQDGTEFHCIQTFVVSEKLKRYSAILGLPALKSLARNFGLSFDFENHGLCLHRDGKPYVVPLTLEAERVVEVRASELMALDEHEKARAHGREENVQIRDELWSDFPSLDLAVNAHEESKLPVDLQLRLRADASLTGNFARYRVSQESLELVKQYVDDFEKRGLIEKCPPSPYSSNVLLVRKKNTSKLRVVIDYRMLNKNLAARMSTHVQPRTEDLLNMLAARKRFSVIDVKDGFYHCALASDEATRSLTAFRTHFGTYRWRRMPMGLKDSPAVFQENLTWVLNDLLKEYPSKIVVFVDDVCIAADTTEECLNITRKVLATLDRMGIRASKEKAQIAQEKVTYLGYEISFDNISLKDKAMKANTIPVPRSKRGVLSFVSFASFFRAFLPKLAEDCAPLYKLQGKAKFEWKEVHQRAFERVRDKLIGIQDLKPSLPSPPDQVIIFSDACDHSIGGLCVEMRGEEMRPLGFCSKTLPPSSSSWATFEKELEALLKCLQHFQHFTRGQNVLCLCDNKPLVQSLNRNELQSEKAKRIVCKLLEHNATVAHIAGCTNPADFPSRWKDESVEKTVWKPEAQMVDVESRELVTMDLDKKVWAAEYKKDELLSRIIQLLLEGGQEDHQWRSKYELRDGLLYLRPARGAAARLVVPRHSKLRQEVLATYHDSMIGGHGGVFKICDRIIQSFFWPKLEKDVRNYIASCVVCARVKALNVQKNTLVEGESGSRPHEIISIDLVTGLPAVPWQVRGQGTKVDTVLTICCALSRFVVYVPVAKSLNSEDVASAIINDYIIPFCAPMPRVIKSDRDTRWTSAVFKSIATKLGIRLALSTAYHAQTNGSTETLNNVLGNFLKAAANRYRDNWPELAPMCALFYNTSVSSALGGRSPAEVKFGFKMNFPFHMADEDGEGELEKPLQRLAERQQVVLQCAKDSLSAYKDLMISATTQEERETRSFKVGDQVMVSTKALVPKNLYVGNRKTSARFIGPYKVLEVVTPGHAFRVQLPEKSKAHPVINISHLKYFLSTDEFQGRPSDEADHDDQRLYLIEQILKHRKRKSAYCFLVKWDRYGPEYNSWEPEESFRQDDGTVVNEILLEYMKKHKINLA